MAKHVRSAAAVVSVFGTALAALFVSSALLVSAAGQAAAQEFEGDSYPSTIEIVINATGGDAIDLYSDGFPGDVYAFMDEIGAAIVRVPWEGTTNDYRAVYDDPRTAGLQLDGRMLAREGDDELVLHVDTTALNQLMSEVGYEEYELTVCAPSVESELVAEEFERPIEDGGCYFWQLVALEGANVEFDLRVRPEPDGYAVLVATLAAVAALASVVGIVGVRLLRRSVLRSFGGVSVAIAAAGVLGGSFVTVVAVIVLSINDGPTTGLVMSREVAQWGNVVATVLPASFLAIPGLAIAVLALRSPVVRKQPAAPAYGGYGTGGYPQAPPPPPPPPPPSTPGPGMPTWLGK